MRRLTLLGGVEGSPHAMEVGLRIKLRLIHELPADLAVGISTKMTNADWARYA